MLIYRDFTFDAAHVLDGYDETHPYGRVHGHSFRARVWIEGEPELESNMIADLGLIAKEWLQKKIDPKYVGSEKSIILKSYEYGKYGRVIGELFIVSGNRKQSINKMMLAEGLVTEYDGGAR